MYRIRAYQPFDRPDIPNITAEGEQAGVMGKQTFEQRLICFIDRAFYDLDGCRDAHNTTARRRKDTTAQARNEYIGS